MERDSYDVIIAGAGIAGLSLAALLSRSGRCSVLLVEREQTPGGRFAVERRDGYRLDFGVHACLLGEKGSIARVLKRCGAPVEIKPIGATLYHGGGLVPFLGMGIPSLVRQRVVGARELAWLGVEAIRSARAGSFGESIDQWVERRGASERVARLLRSLSVGLAPSDRYDRVSCGEILAFLYRVMRCGSAMGYPAGGWGEVLDALAGVIRSAPGCEISLGTGLGGVMSSGGRLTCTVGGGQEVLARAVVFAMPPQKLATGVEFEPALDGEYARSLGSLEQACGVMVDVGLAAPVTPEKRLVMSVEPPALLLAVSNVSPQVAPAGRQLLQLFSPIEKERAGDGALVKERAERLTSLAAEVFGGPLDEEFRRVIATEIVSVVPYTDQSVPERPGIPVPGGRGLFLIGDGVSSPGFGGELAAASALEAERLVLEHLQAEGG